MLAGCWLAIVAELSHRAHLPMKRGTIPNPAGKAFRRSADTKTAKEDLSYPAQSIEGSIK